MRGRKPKPLQRAFAEGDTRHVGAKKLAERVAALPKAARGLPDPPADLVGIAREQWAIWKQDLEIMGQDFRHDAVILEGACVNYARAIEADEILKDGCEVEEQVLDKSTGQLTAIRIKNHPAVARSNLCWRNVHAFCSELGLSITGRVGLSAEPMADEQDDLMEILMRPRPAKPDPNLQ